MFKCGKKGQIVRYRTSPKWQKVRWCAVKKRQIVRWVCGKTWQKVRCCAVKNGKKCGVVRSKILNSVIKCDFKITNVKNYSIIISLGVLDISTLYWTGWNYVTNAIMAISIVNNIFILVYFITRHQYTMCILFTLWHDLVTIPWPPRSLRIASHRINSPSCRWCEMLHDLWNDYPC